MGLKTALVMAALGLPCAAAAAPSPQAIDAVFAHFTPATPGCAVGVEAPGQAPVLRAYGSTDLEHGLANTPDSVFEAGSVSKQFTAAAVLLLAQDGKLSLGDDIRKYIPEMPDYGRPITVDHLLNHTSGLRDWGAVEDIAGWPRGDRAYSMRDVLRIASRQRALNHQPGAAWSYTNTGFNLLALIVERVSGKSFQAFTRERMFTPLGMTHSQWRDDFRRIVPRRAIAYSRRGAGYEQDMPFESAYGNGALLTTAGDLLAWSRALDEGRLGPTLTRRLQEQARLNDGQTAVYARGLYIQPYRGFTEASHSGATAGYRAWLGRYPDRKLSVAILCNTAEAVTADLGHRVVDLFLPSEPPATTVVASGLATHAGLYMDDRDGQPLRLTVNGDGLYEQNGPPVRAAPDGKLSLMGGDIAFLPNGVVRMGHGAEAWTYSRAAPFAPTPADLAAVAGRYHSAEAEVDYAITRDRAGLRLTVEQRPDSSFLLTPAYADAFTFRGYVVRLVRGAGGRVTGIRISNDRVWNMHFDRVS